MFNAFLSSSNFRPTPMTEAEAEPTVTAAARKPLRVAAAKREAAERLQARVEELEAELGREREANAALSRDLARHQPAPTTERAAQAHRPAAAGHMAAAKNLGDAGKRAAVPGRRAEKAIKARSTNAGGSAKLDYAKELDCDFYGTAFEVYNVSKRSKRAGGGVASGTASPWCGALTLGVRQCNWIQKICYGGTGSTRKFCDESLLYLASRDGFFNGVFHRKCDLKGPTVTLVALADGRLFGGYASTPWSAGLTGKYVDDPAAFLFSLSDGVIDGTGRQPIQLRQCDASPKDALFHDSDLGPCFGRALGLQLDILAYSSSDFCSNAKYRMPKDPQGRWNDKTFLAGSYNGWDVQEVGVWLV